MIGWYMKFYWMGVVWLNEIWRMIGCGLFDFNFVNCVFVLLDEKMSVLSIIDSLDVFIICLIWNMGFDWKWI